MSKYFNDENHYFIGDAKFIRIELLRDRTSNKTYLKAIKN